MPATRRSRSRPVDATRPAGGRPRRRGRCPRGGRCARRCRASEPRVRRAARRRSRRTAAPPPAAALRSSRGRSGAPAAVRSRPRRPSLLDGAQSPRSGQAWTDPRMGGPVIRLRSPRGVAQSGRALGLGPRGFAGSNPAAPIPEAQAPACGQLAISRILRPSGLLGDRSGKSVWSRTLPARGISSAPPGAVSLGMAGLFSEATPAGRGRFLSFGVVGLAPAPRRARVDFRRGALHTEPASGAGDLTTVLPRAPVAQMDRATAF